MKINFNFQFITPVTIKYSRIWIGKTGIYLKFGGKGRIGKTLVYIPF